MMVNQKKCLKEMVAPEIWEPPFLLNIISDLPS